VRQRRFRYFIDRNLGSVFLPAQLKRAGVDVVVHDDVYRQTERDPWIFYECGIKKLVVVTSDTLFRKSFPHIAAVALARTSVVAFTNNNFKSEVRGNAFINALPLIEVALKKHRGKYFIGVIGTNGNFRICEESPMPSRKTCDARDWESYARVCQSAGVLPLAPRH
jgi:predicted nuclease of predicted toxin-antitoxin system